jgi:hypothetical protein
LLTEYVDAGGNLLLAGASIAFDWDHTDFLESVVHADYLTAAEQSDIEVALVDHPIAKGFTEGDTIDFVDPPSGETLEIDVVSHTPNARVIFQRGPGSRQAGAASVIAYEDDRSKVAYYAFPFYLLPEDGQEQLAKNTLDWFTRKPLGLPGASDYEPFEQDQDEEATEGETPPECDDTVEGDADNDGVDDTDGDLDDDGIIDCTPEDENSDTGDEDGDNGEGTDDTGDEDGDNGDEGGDDGDGTDDTGDEGGDNGDGTDDTGDEGDDNDSGG